MKLRLNKLMAGLVMAGGAVALVGCGGGDAPDLLPTKIEANIVATDANAVKLASNVAVALVGTPALQLSATAASNIGAPAGSTLSFTGPLTGPGAIAKATIVSGTQSLQTNITAGSCKFTVTGPEAASDRISFSLAAYPLSTTLSTDLLSAYVSLDGDTVIMTTKLSSPLQTTADTETEKTYKIGDTITVKPCAISSDVSDIVEGAAPVPRTVTISVGNGGTVTASTTVERKDGKIIMNGKEVADVSATGAISVD